MSKNLVSFIDRNGREWSAYFVFVDNQIQLRELDEDAPDNVYNMLLQTAIETYEEMSHDD